MRTLTPAESKKVTELVEHLDAIIDLCGAWGNEYPRSETATETLAFGLFEASQEAINEIVDSNDKGLAYDARWTLAEQLLFGPGGPVRPRCRPRAVQQ
jgi:hypothetical protein